MGVSETVCRVGDAVTVGVLVLELWMADSGSLKGKRMALKSLKDRLRHGFNVSVAEVDHRETWQRATVAVVAVGTDRRYVNGLLDEAGRLAARSRHLQVLDARLEWR